MEIISTSTANAFSAAASSGIVDFVENVWPIVLALVILAIAFPVLKKLISVVKHAVGR